MKTWEKYREYLLKGEWHVHTEYTDGNNSVYECCQKAAEVGIPLIAFTEHVRRSMSYDFFNLLNDIDVARDAFELIILSGCEAKVLPNGELDVPDDILKEVDYPIFAFHSFPKNINVYLDSLKHALSCKYINAWAHPGTYLNKYDLEIPDDQLIDIFDLMKNNRVLLEMNSKHSTPPIKWINLAKIYDICLVRGSDVHKISSIVRYDDPNKMRL